jgi:hypothetical protein
MPILTVFMRETLKSWFSFPDRANQNRRGKPPPRYVQYKGEFVRKSSRPTAILQILTKNLNTVSAYIRVFFTQSS